MTETPDAAFKGAADPPETPAELTAEPGGNTCRSCGMGCLGIVILTAITFAVLTSNAAATLDARYVQASEEIVALQARADTRRATVLGQPDNDDNALADYNGLQWVLSGGDPEHNMRLSWKTQLPELPNDIEEMTARVVPDGKEIDIVMTGTLLRGINPEMPAGELSTRDQKNFDNAKAAYARAKPLLRYVRDGLSRGKCDWKTQWEKGFRFEIPNLLQMRAIANLLAYQASLQEPRAGIQTGLELVAFGQDLSRQGSMIGAMIGIAVSHIGFQSLAHTLGRPGIEPADCRRVIEALATYAPPKSDDLLDGEKLIAVVTALEMSGRRLDQSASGDANADSMGVGADVFAKLDVFHARELEGYEFFMSRSIEVTRLPRNERDAAQDALNEELGDSWYFIAKIAIPNLNSVTTHLHESLAMARVTRVLAAAQLHRLEQGSFPTVIEDLEGLLGVGILDPSSATPKTPLGFKRSGKVAHCWLAGENGLNDGGPTPRVYRGLKKKKKKGTSKRKGPRKAPPVQTDDRGLSVRAPGAK